MQLAQTMCSGPDVKVNQTMCSTSKQAGLQVLQVDKLIFFNNHASAKRGKKRELPVGEIEMLMLHEAAEEQELAALENDEVLIIS